MKNEAGNNGAFRQRERAEARAPKPRETSINLQKLPRLQANAYERERDLPRLLLLWPHELSDETVAGARALIARLRCALRAERRRGRTGHWRYDLDRHLALLQAYKCEAAGLAERLSKGES